MSDPDAKAIPQPPEAGANRWRKLMPWLRLECLVLLVVGVYLNSFDVPFLLDDTAITENASIRQWWDLPGLFSPPANSTLSGRPIANISFAINYAITGPSMAGLHLGNLLIHIAAALTLMALIRRLLLLPRLNERFCGSAPWIAFAATVIWAVHPANVTAVTYLVQRTESLASLLYLLTLYCFVRGTESPRPRGWYFGALAACLLGMGTKEMMVSAPLAVLLLDRCFFAQDWRQVWRERGPVHIALFSTWLWLAYLVAGDPRGASAGLDTEVTWLQYAILQVSHWPAMVVWSVIPRGLTFDYGPVIWPPATGPVWVHGVQAALVLVAIVLPVALWARRRPLAGWVLLTMAMVIAPSSSVIPIATQVFADHRGYLMRAGLIALLVSWLAQLAPVRRRWFTATVCVVWGGWFSVLTVQRNDLMADPVALWTDSAMHNAQNTRALNNLGQALIDTSEGSEPPQRDAIAILRRAREMTPQDARIVNNLALAHARLDDHEAALALYDDALTLDPYNATALNNRGAALRALGRDDEALDAFDAALAAAPGYRRAVYNRAMLLLDRGDVDTARAELQPLTRDWPDYPQGHYGMGRVHQIAGDLSAAIEAYERALQLAPGFTEAREHLEACRAHR